jgi:hypothetical protein
MTLLVLQTYKFIALNMTGRCYEWYVIIWKEEVIAYSELLSQGSR